MDDPSSPAEKIALEYYAPMRHDCVPEWSAYCEARIDAGDGPESLCAFFTKPEYAVAYFAGSMNRRFSLQSVGVQCIRCGAAATDFAVASRWNAVIRAEWPSPQYLADDSAYFIMYHAICAQCYVQWRRYIRERIKAIMVSAIAILCLFIFAASGQRWIAIIIQTMLAIVVGLSIVGTLFQRGWNQWPKYLHLALPDGVHHIGDTRLINRTTVPKNVQ